MSKTLNFAALVPERDFFEDVDGKKYEFRSKGDFGAVDMARANKLTKDLQQAMSALEANPEDESAARQFEATTEEFVRLILPNLPAERLSVLTLGQKAAIAQWWNESAMGKQSAGEAIQKQ